MVNHGIQSWHLRGYFRACSSVETAQVNEHEMKDIGNSTPIGNITYLHPKPEFIPNSIDKNLSHQFEALSLLFVDAFCKAARLRYSRIWLKPLWLDPSVCDWSFHHWITCRYSGCMANFGIVIANPLWENVKRYSEKDWVSWSGP